METGYDTAVCASEAIMEGMIEAAIIEYNRKKKEE